MRVPAQFITGLVAVVAAGCSLLPSGGSASMRLEMNNGATIPVVLTVNGGVGREVAPGTVANLGPAEIGPLPWDAVVRTRTGRVLLQLAVHDGDVSQTSNSSRGVASRVDLSCGRIDLWSGPPLLGPAPGPGSPGDCDP